MAGRPGRSGGSNKLPVALHIQRGTYSATRHGPKPAFVAPVARPRTEPLPEGLTDGLQGRGKVFVETCWATYSGWSPASTTLLKETGHLLEQVDALRGQPDERSAQRLLLAALAQLRLD